MRMEWGRLARCALLGSFVAVAGCGATDPAPRPAATAPLSQDVADALRRMSDSIARAPAFTVRVHTLRDGRVTDGPPVLLSGQSVIAARRPDRVTATVGSDIANFSLWYDGRAVTIMNAGANVYGSTPMTGPLDGVVRFLENRMGIDLPVRPLLMADPYAAMMEAGPTTGRFVGRTLVGSTPTDHFALQNPRFDWEIWLEATDRALPRRVAIRLRDGTRAIMEFDQWNLNPRLPDGTFVFVPPRGAVPATVQLMPGAGSLEVSR